MRLENVKVLVTGGLGFLGKALTAEIENYGGIPIPTSRNLSEIEKFNCRSKDVCSLVRAEFLDFSSEKSLIGSLESILEKQGTVSGLVNNAYANLPFKDVEETDWNYWLEATKVNVAAAHTLSVALRRKGLKSVVNIASMFGIVAPHFNSYPEDMKPNPVTYGPTKAALLSLTRYLAAHWGGEGIRVNAVSPGGIANHQPEDFLERYNQSVPMNRMVTADEVAKTVVFLLSNEATGITGQNIVIDGGRTVW